MKDKPSKVLMMILMLILGMLVASANGNEKTKSRRFRMVWLSNTQILLQAKMKTGQDAVLLVELNHPDKPIIHRISLPEDTWLIARLGNGKGATIAKQSATEGNKMGIIFAEDFHIEWLPVEGGYPVSDPKGTRIAYKFNDEAGLDLYIWDLEKSERRRITYGLLIREFSWSPKGERLAYIGTPLTDWGSFGDAQVQLVIGQTYSEHDSGTAFLLLCDRSYKRWMTWIDSERLAFCSPNVEPNSMAVYFMPTGDRYLPHKVIDIPPEYISPVGRIWRGNFLFSLSSPAEITRTDANEGKTAKLCFSEIETGDADLAYWSPSLDGSKCIAVLKDSQDLLLGDFTAGKVSKLTVLSE